MTHGQTEALSCRPGQSGSRCAQTISRKSASAASKYACSRPSAVACSAKRFNHSLDKQIGRDAAVFLCRCRLLVGSLWGRDGSVMILRALRNWAFSARASAIITLMVWHNGRRSDRYLTQPRGRFDTLLWATRQSSLYTECVILHDWGRAMGHLALCGSIDIGSIAVVVIFPLILADSTNPVVAWQQADLAGCVYPSRIGTGGVALRSYLRRNRSRRHR